MQIFNSLRIIGSNGYPELRTNLIESGKTSVVRLGVRQVSHLTEFRGASLKEVENCWQAHSSDLSKTLYDIV